ncbi:MAG TPA: tyrosine-protein phosphatase [Pyrinomonadaceae bacterium]|jgi:protein tyrosine/serine phosphatase
MRDRRFKTLAVLILAIQFCLSTVSAQSLEPRYPELPNFHQVNQGLYRGAQPRPEGIQRLVALGIKTVLNLRAADERSRAEEREARALGLRYFNIPMEGLDRPRDEQVERALALINDAANQPVFVHCKRGADRTGTVIAVYRITHDGWSGAEALREAKRYGLSWVEFGMKDYIKDYGRDHGAQKPSAP